MSRIATWATLTLLLGASTLVAQDGASTGPKPLALGATAPAAEMKMKSVDGREVSVADVRGAKGTLVVFTSNQCPFARAWEERIVRLANAAPGQGIGAIAVNSNDPERVPDDGFAAMQERAKQKGFRFPYVVDAGSELARAYGAARTPEAFLLDAEGRLAYHGAIDDNAQDASAVTEHYLRDAIEAVASGRPVAVKETKAIGCGIKLRPRT